MNKGVTLLLGLLLALGALVSTPASADEPISTNAIASTEWREYTSSGRQWREKCSPYSSTVTRCRIEIRATVASWNGSRFITSQGWMFNNLVYRPSPREHWAGNPLATPGEHTIDGRRWRTVCDTAWTGRGACRSEILASIVSLQGGRYRHVTQWVFNNTVEFLNGDGTVPTLPRPDTVITQTTAAEVSSTYRKGCPVGPGGLRTIRINQFGMDGTIHRGEIIVRADLATRVANSFEQMFAARFPVAQMRNPNIWNASDVNMMRANNTSAFNCRRVVGNPARLSPHSYGTAVDINPVQNPYRDPTGRWWPSTQYSTNRPASVPGLHTPTSASVVAFTGNGFRWFSGWDWHHFEYPRTSRAALTLNPASPAATTAGELDRTSLPQPDGWDRVALDGSPDEGFTGNGTWLHAVDPARKGSDVLAIGCAATTTDAPAPIAALEGNLSSEGRPGVSIAMQFASDGAAQEYFAVWQSQMRACIGTSVTELETSDDTWWGHWDVDGSLWSEAAGQRGDTVKLTLLEAELDAEELEMVAEDF